MEFPVLGMFEKGIEGSCALNFGLAGGTHCSLQCAVRKFCYAKANENRFNRKQFKKKLKRHQKTSPLLLVQKAIEEVKYRISKGKKPAWFRFSTDGSLPMPKHVTKALIKELRRLLRLLKSEDIPYHLPLETSGKTRFYQKRLGKSVVIRQSFAMRNIAFLNSAGPSSAVTGTFGQTQDERLEAARKLAKKRYELTGRKCIVCPAIVASFKFITELNRVKSAKMKGLPYNPPVKNSKAKCGNCKACALPHMDVVYPFHK